MGDFNRTGRILFPDSIHKNTIVLQLIHNDFLAFSFCPVLDKVVQGGITLPNLFACEIRYAFCSHGLPIFTEDADYLSSYCYFLSLNKILDMRL